MLSLPISSPLAVYYSNIYIFLDLLFGAQGVPCLFTVTGDAFTTLGDASTVAEYLLLWGMDLHSQGWVTVSSLDAS